MGNGRVRRGGLQTRTSRDASSGAPATRRLAPSAATCDLEEPWLSNNESGYKGVAKMPLSGNFRAAFGDTILGYFGTAREAALALTRHPPAREYRRRKAERSSWHSEHAQHRLSLQDAQWHAQREGLTLTPAQNSAGYRGVTVDGRKELPYIAYFRKELLGRFWTAHEASLCYERHVARVTAEEAAEAAEGAETVEARDDAGGASGSAATHETADVSTALSHEEAVRIAASEGLRLIEAPNTRTGYKGVCQREWKSRPGHVVYYASMTVAGATYRLGATYPSAAAAALALARRGLPDVSSRLNEDKRIAMMKTSADEGARSIFEPPTWDSAWRPVGCRDDNDDTARGDAAEAMVTTRARHREEAALPSDARLAKRQARAPPECAICMERLDEASWGQTPCGHAFHLACLRQWLQLHVTCPECRHRVSVSTRRAFVAIHERSTTPA
jgi:hypothetical protein